MADRLSALDASLLSQEERHAGTVAILRRPRSGFDYGQLVALIRRRLHRAPRYRQRVVPVPGRLARPVWVDDADFDLTYHVRRSALPRPGTEEQLLDLVARLMSRPLDRSRPLWEAYLVEGLARGRLALVTKTHRALADDIGRLILAENPQLPEHELDDDWRPATPPGPIRRMLDAVRETVHRPLEVIENIRSVATDVITTARRLIPARTIRTGGKRRFVVARATDLTGDDVVLAVLTGALRTWRLSRGEPVTTSTTLRALMPPRVIDLPVGEPNPAVRLQHIGHLLRSPPSAARRTGNLVITIGHAPPRPLYTGTAQVLETFPVPPLARDQALAIGVTSYNGSVYFGLSAMSDVDILAGMLEESVEELLTTPRRS